MTAQIHRSIYVVGGQYAYDSTREPAGQLFCACGEPGERAVTKKIGRGSASIWFASRFLTAMVPKQPQMGAQAKSKACEQDKLRAAGSPYSPLPFCAMNMAIHLRPKSSVCA